MPSSTLMIWHNGLQLAPSYLGAPGFEAAVPGQTSLIGLPVGYCVPALMNQLHKAIRKIDGLGPHAGHPVPGRRAGRPRGPAPHAPVPWLPFGCFLALATLIVVCFGRARWLGYLRWVG